jgi:CrcB protein
MRLGAFLIGAFIGAPTRYLIDQYFRAYMKFPLGILMANVSGSFLLGLLLDSETPLAFGLMGFCGALTTWSALSLDLFNELSAKNYKAFAVNLLSTYGLGITAAALGIWVAQ